MESLGVRDLSVWVLNDESYVENCQIGRVFDKNFCDGCREHSENARGFGGRDFD